MEHGIACLKKLLSLSLLSRRNFFFRFSFVNCMYCKFAYCAGWLVVVVVAAARDNVAA
jgi:hypothetical protein